MIRRRAKAVLRTELPVRASDARAFEPILERALDLLSNPDSEALARLAMIARTYHDGRQMEARKVKRPDCRKSLEALSATCIALSEVLTAMPEEHRRFLDGMIRGELHAASDRPFLPNGIGHALVEIAEIDLRRLLPNTPTAMEPVLARFELLATELADRCMRLPQDAEWLLIELQQYCPSSPDEEAGDECLHWLIETVGRLAHVAAELMKSDRGPRSDRVQMRAVQALKAEFEAAGGTATHNAKGKEGYTGEATTPFGRFVHVFFADLETENRLRRGLDEAIAFVCWESRQRGRRPKVEDAALMRAKRIVGLLMEAGVTNFSASASPSSV
jgi:hypothetical protein